MTVLDGNNQPVNITSARVIFTVKEHAEDTNICFQKTSDNSQQITITAPRSGVVLINVTPADTQHLAIKQYVFDVWVVLASGKRYPVVPPTVFEVTAGVTLLPL